MMPPVMDSPIFAHALLDQFEGRIGGPSSEFRWEGQAWVGTDYDKFGSNPKARIGQERQGRRRAT